MLASVDLAALHGELGQHGRASRAAPCLEQENSVPQNEEPGAGWGGEQPTHPALLPKGGRSVSAQLRKGARGLRKD